MTWTVGFYDSFESARVCESKDGPTLKTSKIVSNAR